MMTLFEALGDPTRRRILDLLRERARLVGDLAELLTITQPNVSKHLRVLREVGLVRVRQDAQWRWYELNPEPLAEITTWLEPYRQIMEARYDRLDTLFSSEEFELELEVRIVQEEGLFDKKAQNPLEEFRASLAEMDQKSGMVTDIEFSSQGKSVTITAEGAKSVARALRKADA